MKKLLLILTAALIMIFLFIVILNFDSRIPDLKVTCQGTRADVLKCPFSWNTIFHHTMKDYPSAPDISEDIGTLAVESQSFIELSFSRKPDDIEVHVWNIRSDSEDLIKWECKGNRISAPKESGHYVIDVIGYWKRGQVLYVFKINVR